MRVHKQKPLLLWLPLSLPIAALGAACAQSTSPQQPQQIELAQQPVSSTDNDDLERSAVDRPPPTIERDPYASYLERSAPADDGSLTALQRIPLDRLRVVGTALSAAPLALVEDATGLGHVVHIGTPIGTAGGRVTVIEQGKIVVEERFRDHSHRVLKVHKELPLRAKSG